MKNLYKISSERRFRGIFNKNDIPKTEVITPSIEKSPKEVLANKITEGRKDIKDINYSNFKIGNFEFDELQAEQFDALLGGLFGKLINLLDDKDSSKIDDDENSAELKEESEDDKNLRKAELSEFIKKGEKLTAENALKSLNPNISIKSTDHGYHRRAELCKKRNSSNTSLEGILPRTISGANFLQKQLGIPLVITGGTEDGHGGGKNGGIGTHGFGSKLDFSFKNGVDAAIKSYIGRSIAFGKGQHNGKRIKTSGKFKGEYETWTINDGGYKIVITRETKVPGKEHYDIKFS